MSDMENVRLPPPGLCESDKSRADNVPDPPQVEPSDPDVLYVNRDNVVFIAKLIDAVIQKARIEEIQKLKKFGTFNVIDDVNQERISTRWVDTIKEDGSKISCLVVRGFEEQEYIQSDSPTFNKQFICLFVVICVVFDWTIKIMDVKSAFLQGEEMDRDVVIQPPKGYEQSGKLWRLRKCLYGLNDTARKFYMSVKQTLLSFGCEMLDIEPALFVYKVGGKVMGIIMSHVNDFLYGGNVQFECDVMKPLTKKYKASRQESKKFKYVGLTIMQDNDQVIIH